MDCTGIGEGTVRRSIGIAICFRFALDTRGLSFGTKRKTFWRICIFWQVTQSNLVVYHPNFGGTSCFRASSLRNLKSHKQIILPIFPATSRIYISTVPPPGRSGDRILVGGEIFRTFPDRPGAHLTSYTMRTRPFSGVKRSGCGVNHHPYLAPRLKETVQHYIYSPSEPLWTVTGWTLPALRTSFLQYSVTTMCVFCTPWILLNCNALCFWLWSPLALPNRVAHLCTACFYRKFEKSGELPVTMKPVKRLPKNWQKRQ